MASENESDGRDNDDLNSRLDQRSAADLRRMEAQERRLAEDTDLPMVRRKHLEAAERWGAMAAERERVDRRARERASALGAHSPPAP